jgi:ribosomal protein S18 acetylase RimI-like enzyme
MAASDPTLHWIGPHNAALLDHVDDEVFDHAVRPELLQAFLAAPSNLLVVAVHDGAVVGMASGLTYVHPDKPLALFINEVGVSARLHGRGIGKRLVAAMLQRGRELGCAQAWVATEEGNAPARALYASTGGQPDEDKAVVYVYPLDQMVRS